MGRACCCDTQFQTFADQSASHKPALAVFVATTVERHRDRFTGILAALIPAPRTSN